MPYTTFLYNYKIFLSHVFSKLSKMNFCIFKWLIISRFDHFAIICEVIPVGLLSAAVNMAVLKSGQYGSEGENFDLIDGKF